MLVVRKDISSADRIVLVAHSEGELHQHLKKLSIDFGIPVHDSPDSHVIYGNGFTVEKRYGKFDDYFS